MAITLAPFPAFDLGRWSCVRLGFFVLASSAALIFGGCQAPATAECQEMLCPGGRVCHPVLESKCVLPEQIRACEGLKDGEPCNYGNVTDAVCSAKVCEFFTCGDNQKDEGEVCDDGNRLSGDGCRDDCRSDETCANGIIDHAAGEACDGQETCTVDCREITCGDGKVDADEVCDDGNNASGDGCHKNCISDETCGNGVVDNAVGEQCDEGDTDPGDGCGPTCRIEICGNDVLDPGEDCDNGDLDSGDGCGPTCLFEECGNGFVDAVVGEECDDANAAAGDGCGPTCVVEVCGNGYEDPGEECDDANVKAGDGCGPTCLFEECGNEFLDPGEECDTGPFLNHDGCDSVCNAEATLWQEWSSPLNESARMAFDSWRGEIIILSGQDPRTGAVLTWRFRDSGWSLARTPTGPDRIAGVAFDATRGVAVTYVDESTWEWDGALWREVATTSPIGFRGTSAQLAYDSHRGGVVLVGDGTQLGTTTPWLWNGQSWSEIVTSGTKPPARRLGHAIAYDTKRRRLVLHAGFYGGSNSLNDTWELTEQNKWIKFNGTSPGARSRHVLAYDPLREVTVMIGGSGTGPNGKADTWEWDGASWTPSIDLSPEQRTNVGATFDPNREKLFVSSGTSQTDVRLYDGAWTPVPVYHEPPDIDVLGSYDAVRQEVVVFGEGAETWVFNGLSWERRFPDHSPPERIQHGVTTDTLRGRVLVHGGATPANSAIRYDDFWAWNGNDWQELTPSGPAPSARFNASLTYDPVRDEALLFGGWYGTTRTNETWAWDGTSWTNVSDETGPRGRHQSIFSQKHGGIITHGGLVLSGGTSSEFLLWNVDSWEQLETSNSPAVHSHGLAVDERRQLILLFDGTMRELADTTWVIRKPNIAPSGRDWPAMVHFGWRGTLLYGGESLGDTWIYSTNSELSDELCGNQLDDDGDALSDCDDPDCNGEFCGYGAVCTNTSCQCPSGSTETACEDATDDDCDGLIDCADPDCDSSAYCSPEQDCADGNDNDSDGATDCADPGCAGVANCELRERSCDDGVDNDGDGLADCADMVDCYLSGSTIGCP